MLFPTKARPFKYKNNKCIVQAIKNFNFKLIPNKPLLSPMHRQYLNPMRLNIVGAKKLPMTDNQGKYLDVYVKVKFFDGEIVKT